MQKLGAYVEEALKQGRTKLNYREVAAYLQVSPSYARELLQVFSLQKGYPYMRGTMFLVVPPNGEEAE